MQKRTKSRQNIEIKYAIIKHISENINIYFKVIILFIIGICIGITAINQLSETNAQNINDYITNSVNTIKSNAEISKIQMLKLSLFKNIIIVLLIWFFSLTLVGSFILYIFILIIGITFGYSLSAIMMSFTYIQGMLFCATAMLIQNIINIPTITFYIVQGVKTHKNILNNKNITLKYAVAKHSAYAIFVMIILVISSFVEVYVSGNLVYSIAKYL